MYYNLLHRGHCYTLTTESMYVYSLDYLLEQIIGICNLFRFTLLCFDF